MAKESANNGGDNVIFLPGQRSHTLEQALTSGLTSTEQEVGLSTGLITSPSPGHALEYHDDNLRVNDGNSIATIAALEKAAVGAAFARGQALEFLDGDDDQSEPTQLRLVE